MYLGASPIDTFLLTYPKPSAMNVADLLNTVEPSRRGDVAQELIARGVPAAIVSQGLSRLDFFGKLKSMRPQIMGTLVLASAAVSAYHGFRRNNSVTGGVVWFLMGSLFPVLTPIAAIAMKPGFAKPKS